MQRTLHTKFKHSVTDQDISTRFWVDTGAEVRITPPFPSDRERPPDILTLMAVNNTPITTYGKRSLTLNLGLHRNFQWIFLVVDIQKPIIGADFLRHFALLGDMRQHQLTDTSTHLCIQGIVMQDPSPSPVFTPKNTGDSSSFSVPYSYTSVLP